MIALKLTNIKDFMNKLLRTELFDHFLLQEATITGAASFVIDGHIHKDFFSQEEFDELELAGCPALPFSMLRANCFDLIKGKKIPSYFKFVFLLSPENLSHTLSSLHSSFTPDDLSAVCLNIKFQNQMLVLTTGISYHTFSTDRSLESEWDSLTKRFLNQHQISFEELS